MSLLYDYLRKNLKVCKLTTRQDEINIRCPFCLDSQKDEFKGHFYIQNQEPFKYYCQKCGASGRVNNKLLELLSVDSYAVIKEIQNANIVYKKKLKIKYGNDLSYFSNKELIFPENNIKDKNKIDYIENRLGIKITKEDISRYKIIFNLNEFLNANKITKIIETNKKNYSFMKNINTINNYCIGFLSSDKSTIIFRSLDKNKTGYRYNNFTLFPEIDSKKTYILGNQVNLSSSVYNIIITEGIFDIIGVYNHIYNKQISNNTLYMANAGKSYIVTANLLKKLSILNSNINIYSDSDVDIKFYKNIMKDEIYYRLNGMNIFYNKIGKDFGVKKNEIVLSEKIEL